MGVAIYISVQSEVEGFDAFVNGKAIGRASEKVLEKICKGAGVRSIFEYVSQDPDELREFIEDFGGDVPEKLPEEEWFPPEDGVQFTNALIAHLEANPKAVRGSAALIEDLVEYREVFERLVKERVPWHFSVDV